MCIQHVIHSHSQLTFLPLRALGRHGCITRIAHLLLCGCAIDHWLMKLCVLVWLFDLPELY